MTDLATNPQGGEAVAEQVIDNAPQGVDTDAQDTNLNADQGDGTEPLDGQPDLVDDSEEIDYEGAKYKVPKPLKDAFLRQADYTQKTQALAAERQTLDGHRQAFAQQVQTHQATAAERLQLAVLDHQISQYTTEALREIAATNPNELPLVQLELQQLQQQRAALAGGIQQKEAQALDLQRQQAATHAQQANAYLRREIQGWNDQVYGQVIEHGASYGFSAAEVGQVADPRVIKALHDAMQWRAHQAAQQRAAKVQQQQRTAPTHTLRGAGGQFAADPKGMTMEQYVAARQAGKI